jgi:hypothetical protein
MDDTIDVFFSYSINYVLFHSLIIVYKKIVSRKCGCVVESPNVLEVKTHNRTTQNTKKMSNTEPTENQHSLKILENEVVSSVVVFPDNNTTSW